MLATGVYNFASAMQFPLSGVSGIALILYHLFGLPIGAMTFIINIPIIIFTYKILGKKVLLKSLKTIIISSVFTDVIAPLLPVFTGDRLLAALCCGVLSGASYAIIFMRDSSTGGVDLITLAIRKKKPHFSIGNIYLILDIAVIIPGVILVSKDVESLIYGIIIAWITSTVTDKLMYGISQGKVAMIVTDNGDEISHCITEVFDRGVTILPGKGGYTGTDRDVLMCACNKKQMFGIRKLIKQIDPKSFLVILESSEVVGEGFKSE